MIRLFGRKEISKESAKESLKKAGFYLLYITQAVQDLLPEKVASVVSIASTIKEMKENKEEFERLLNTFYDTLTSVLERLRVNQFHKSYNTAIDKVNAYLEEAVKMINENKGGLLGRLKSFLSSGEKLEDLKKSIEDFKLLSIGIPGAQSYDIRSYISDLKAASFWNKYAQSDLMISYDDFKNAVEDCAKLDYSALTRDTQDLVTDQSKFQEAKDQSSPNFNHFVTMRHFNYVVSWLGGWDNFIAFVKDKNPFTKQFLREATKVVKPPLYVEFEVVDGKLQIAPTPSYWYTEDLRESHSLSYIVYYKKEGDELWSLTEIEREPVVLGISLDCVYHFKVFSAHKEKGLISEECFSRVIDFNSFVFQAEDKETEFQQSKVSVISPNDFVLPDLPTNRSAPFEIDPKAKGGLGVSWAPSKENKEIIAEATNYRPVIYVTKAAYSLAEKLGFFFSPEILFSQWKDPTFIKKSPFTKSILGPGYKTENDKRVEFLYKAILMYNSKHNDIIVKRFKTFNWKPSCDEKSYKELEKKFDPKEADEVKGKCEKLSKEFASVIIEYLRDATTMRLCAAGAQSNIQGYLASPDKKTLEGLNTGRIVVISQTILNSKNVFIYNNKLDGVTEKALKSSVARLTGDVFSSVASECASIEGDVWINSGSKRPVPTIFLPGQIPFSYVEKEFIVKGKYSFDNYTAPVRVEDILNWMDKNPPKVPCTGLRLASDTLESTFIQVKNGIEFYARGSFVVELMSGPSFPPFLKIIVDKDKAVFEKSGAASKIVGVVPVGYSDLMYIGYRIKVNSKHSSEYRFVFEGIGALPFEVESIPFYMGVENFSVRFSPVPTGKGVPKTEKDTKKIDIINLCNIKGPERAGRTKMGEDDEIEISA